MVISYVGADLFKFIYRLFIPSDSRKLKKSIRALDFSEIYFQVVSFMTSERIMSIPSITVQKFEGFAKYADVKPFTKMAQA